MKRFMLALSVLSIWCPSVARAQSAQAEASQDQTTGHGITLGTVHLFPSLSLRDVGRDSNIYNGSTVLRDDFTYTVVPGIRLDAPIGNAKVTSAAGLGFVYFRTTKDQQAVNANVSGSLTVPTGAVRPSLLGSYGRNRQRSGDIDVRVLTTQTTLRAGMDVAVSGLTMVTGWVARGVTDYAAGEVFRGADLSEQLDRHSTTAAGGLRFDITPLTSVVAALEYERAHFTTASFRDQDSFRFAPTVNFAEGAIVTGQAFVGIRDFRVRQGGLAGYRGLIAGGDVRYTLFGGTRVTMRALRDLVNSFDAAQPYYLETGANGIISQPVVGPIDIIGVAGRRAMRYQVRDGSNVPARRERTATWGAGIGIRVQDGVRFTFIAERERRSNDLDAQRRYERTRVFAGLEYQP